MVDGDVSQLREKPGRRTELGIQMVKMSRLSIVVMGAEEFVSGLVRNREDVRTGQRGLRPRGVLVYILPC